MTQLKRLLTSPYNITMSSLILGFWFWYFLSALRPLEIHLDIPLSFYGQTTESHTFEACELVTVALKGYKKDLYTLNLNNLAIHINSDALTLGDNPLVITEKHLFLPEEIKLVNYSPSTIVVRVKKESV